MPRGQGNKNQIMRQGNLIYIDDGTDFYPVTGNTAGYLNSVVKTLPQREYFIFYPGASELASTSTITGMVLSGVRKGSGTVTTANSASTYWLPDVTYAPARSGSIDGKATGGVVSGQITVGLLASANTCDAKITARIKNNAGGTYTTCLFLSATVVALGATTEIFKTYDIPNLLTDANFNAIPFDFAIGVQSDKASASAAVIARIMENSYMEGYFEPS